MPNGKVSITTPVKVVSDSKARVAFDLMQHIASKEINEKEKEHKTPLYWLSLYRKCYKAADGQLLSFILEEN